MASSSPARKSQNTVAQKRQYNVLSAHHAREVAGVWLEKNNLAKVIGFGLPEIDDRYHVWRVPLVSLLDQTRVGEIVIDAYTSLVIEKQSTAPEVVVARLLHQQPPAPQKTRRRKTYKLSTLRNTIALGDSEEILSELPAESVDLIFTSPPYFNARPEYDDYISYEEYLLKMRRIIKECHRTLNEGRFFVINVSPILIRRASRNQSSKRIAVPFDIHQIFVSEGYDFIDDIIWVKPEGAGWATGRGRRFAADRTPLQYKPVPVTEYLLVYRKHTDRLIDWNIRSHPKPALVAQSKVPDGYERTNVWYIKPAHDKEHPAVFPEELASKVITYYSFIDDVVLDPFAGIGTVGQAAARLNRRFVLIEKEPRYVEVIRRRAKNWLGKEAQDILCINCPPIDVSDLML